MHEGEILVGQREDRVFPRQLVVHQGADECAAVVIGAVAVMAIGHRIDRVLQDAGVVGQAAKVREVDVRNGGDFGGLGAGFEDRARLAAAFFHRGRRQRQVRPRHFLPDHRPAVLVGAAANRGMLRLVAEQLVHVAARASESPNGNSRPRPSASISSACQYGVETTAFPAPTA